MSNKIKRARGSMRSKLGLPAKAGRRKVYGNAADAPKGSGQGRRKTKDWSQRGRGWVMNTANGSKPYSPLVYKARWKTGEPVMVIRNA